jgi:hypothetical protein
MALWLLLSLTLTSGGEAVEKRELDPALLALCKSSDVAARRFCLDSIARQGDPRGEAKQLLADLAAHDAALHEEAAEAYERIYGEKPAGFAPPAPQPAPLPPDAARAAGDPMRVVYAPTAFTRPPGAASFNAYELGTFTFDRGMSPNVALGFHTAIPAGAVLVGPTLRVGVPFQGGAFGIQLNALLIAPFVGNSSALVVAGGGPILTLGNYERYFNLGMLAYFVSSANVGVFVPNLGFSVRVSQSVRFGAELYLPAATGGGSNLGFGRAAVLLWGLRIFGDSIWGDVALADPFCDGCSDLYKSLPLGIPFLNFGVGW